MGESINLRTLCKLVGVERLTILRWVKKGLPHTREKGRHGGHAQLWFDKESALSWVSANGSLTAGRKAAALANSLHETDTARSSPESKKQDSLSPDISSRTSAPAPESAPSSKRTVATIDMDAYREPGLLGNLERLKAQELATSAALIRAKQANDTAAVVALSDRHIQETKTLANLEQVALTYRTRLGELGPRQQMQGVFEKVIVGIKNAVLGIPSTAVAQILPYLRDPDDAFKVREILDKVTRDSLRSIGERPSSNA